MMQKINFYGRVQGVGFRPFIYRRCKKLGLHGHVRNTGNSVELLINRKVSVKKLLIDLPSIARVDKTTALALSKTAPANFVIKPSPKQTGSAEIPPDIATCPDCLKDMNDPKSHRQNYAFIACTNCGPRFSVVKSTPYDRDRTSMAKFPLCPKCLQDYQNPETRWYHAETTACPKCGPKYSLFAKGKQIACSDPITKTAHWLRQEKIVAIKGIGGFHLVCLAKRWPVQQIRSLTNRPRKPFALLVPDLLTARKLCKISNLEQKFLTSPARPIVVLSKHNARARQFITPLDSLGLMLPHTGLHYQLFDQLNEPLIFTSANMPGEPLTTKRSQQFADFILDHNRDIINPIDDSVIKIINNHPLFLRRARGYTPATFSHKSSRKALALGAEQNNTFALQTKSKLILAQHQGNTRKRATLRHMQRNLQKYQRFYNFKPQAIKTDAHPQYRTAKYGLSLAHKSKLTASPIQHHLAHVKSVAFEHDLTNYIGIAADGSGYGTDGTIWGGEVLFVRGNKWHRAGSLEPQPMLGGDLATQEPPRMLLGILAGFLNEQKLWPIMNKYFTRQQFSLLYSQAQQKFNAPLTTSTGRILDATAALLGFCTKRTYEGEPAITLEARSSTPYRDLNPQISSSYNRLILETTSLFKYLLKNTRRDKARLAATSQLYLAQGFLDLAHKVNPKLPIVFAGGVAYNRIITTYLSKHGVLLNKKIPPGDGGISVGQLV
ncbi:carbamoyltransferase HypF [Patescibacteria group bacterium]